MVPRVNNKAMVMKQCVLSTWVIRKHSLLSCRENKQEEKTPCPYSQGKQHKLILVQLYIVFPLQAVSMVSAKNVNLEPGIVPKSSHAPISIIHVVKVHGAHNTIAQVQGTL